MYAIERSFVIELILALTVVCFIYGTGYALEEEPTVYIPPVYGSIYFVALNETFLETTCIDDKREEEGYSSKSRDYSASQILSSYQMFRYLGLDNYETLKIVNIGNDVIIKIEREQEDLVLVDVNGRSYGILKSLLPSFSAYYYKYSDKRLADDNSIKSLIFRAQLNAIESYLYLEYGQIDMWNNMDANKVNNILNEYYKEIKDVVILNKGQYYKLGMPFLFIISDEVYIAILEEDIENS